MHIDNNDLALVKTILQNHIPEYKVWAFGSRVHGRHLKPFSDFDLVVVTDKPLDLDRYCELKEAFSESLLPFRVDVVDWACAALRFREIILKSYEEVR